ncbi:MAG: NFACT RNA binding domain-containing protein [Acidobacteriia bacterium]|nr:NFACT RNA binding domain-containing protein [Terriglobia bacterium]
MDNLVLIRVAAVLGPALRGTLLREIREESSQRFRLVFEGEDRAATVLLSLDPVHPWVGRPASRWDGPRRAPGPFAAKTQRTLAGLKVRDLTKAGSDRVLILDFSDGQALVVELATHGANLIHVDSGGNVLASARHPRKAQERIAPGRPYRLPSLPEGRLVPFGASADDIDAFLRRAVGDGEDLFEVLRRRTFGIGSEAAALVLDEVRLSGRSAGDVLGARLARLAIGELDPVVAGSEDPLAEASRGALDVRSLRLLPWEPPQRAPGEAYLCGRDAAATAGLFHEAVEKAQRAAARIEALRRIVDAEVRRLFDAERRITADLEGLGDPERLRRFGEAILAGMGRARRVGDHAWVPDPYDPDGGEIGVPAPAGRTLHAVVDDCFQRSRKARRGLETARGRREAIRLRLARLERLRADVEAARGEDGAERIEAALRGEAIPVALGPATRAGRASARAERPRLEGVRLLTSSDGLEILIGKTGRDNDRLTFKLASPEDFWLHAAGVSGAHVVVRNPNRRPFLPRATLVEAANAAAWFSSARGASQADVQWTRRKHVRRLKGASSGTVSLKRFETIRIKPSPPPGIGWESD